jgi:hypothetical protein
MISLDLALYRRVVSSAADVFEETADDSAAVRAATSATLARLAKWAS